MAKRILVTGSRNYQDRAMIQKWLSRVIKNLHPDDTEPPVLVHGGARGADSLAEEYWKQLGYPVEIHPADWDAYGRAGGFIRNKEMAKAGADICVAFPLGESRGTRNMMKLAKEYGITVLDTEEAERLELYHAQQD